MELYWAGKKREAFDMFGRVQAFATIPGATEYLMVARGVFPEGTKQRPQPMEPEARQAGGAVGRVRGAWRRARLDGADRQGEGSHPLRVGCVPEAFSAGVSGEAGQDVSRPACAHEDERALREG